MKSTIVWVNWGLIGLLLLVIVINNVLIFSNRDRQQTANANQQTIAESNALAQVNQALIQALVSGAVNRNDEQIRKLLGEAGITFTVNETQQPVGTPAPAEGMAPPNPALPRTPTGGAR